MDNGFKIWTRKDLEEKFEGEFIDPEYIDKIYNLIESQNVIINYLVGDASISRKPRIVLHCELEEGN